MRTSTWGELMPGYKAVSGFIPDSGNLLIFTTDFERLHKIDYYNKLNSDETIRIHGTEQ